MNIWEEPLVLKDDLPKFISVVLPSNPLSKPETLELNRGWEMQRCRRQSPPPKTPISTYPDRIRPITGERRPRTMPAPRRRTVQVSKTFITEYQDTKPQDATILDDAASIAQSVTTSHVVNDVIRVNKTVTLPGDEITETADPLDQNASSKTVRIAKKKKTKSSKTRRDSDVFVDDDTKENIQQWLKAAKT